MSQPVIRIENLSKSYLIGHQGPKEKYLSLRDTLSRHTSNFARRTLDTVRGKQMLQGDSIEEFWALKDVSFEVNQGEVLGIIGRNGAGKSTLLKILSRITEPTKGRVELRGRVASLLEVGTGFHPELTGRENITLNGAILGMSRREIKRKFDEIVDFAGVEKFLDTPVKRYSSGMYVRLAFAVAAHLEPEILVVDEVLAVGDADFQTKCMGKMKDVASHGRTVLFVSHAMGAVSSLCTRCIQLNHGEVVANGPTMDVITSYFRKGKDSPYQADYTQGRKISGDGATLLSGMIADESGSPLAEAEITKPLQIRMTYRLDAPRRGFYYPNFHVYDDGGNCIFIAAPEGPELPGQPGQYEAVCNIPAHFLNDGTYFIGLALTYSDGSVREAFHEKDALCLHVRDPMEETLYTKRNGYAGKYPGAVRPFFNWDIKTTK